MPRHGPVSRRQRPARLAAFAIGACLTPALLMAQTPAAKLDGAPPFETVPQGLVRHSGNYPAMTVAWANVTSVKDVAAVFPHPVLPGRTVIATAGGLMLSEDYGQNWQPLPQATVDQIGQANDIVFRIDQPDSFYVASNAKGVWATTDNGRNFQHIGSKATGLASDSALSIELYAHDTKGRTLLITHAGAAAGISRSVDAGKTWSVLFPDYQVQRIYTASGQGIFIIAAPKDEPDSMRLYITPSLGEAWQEMARDILCTGLVSPRLQENWLLVATADRGIIRITRGGGVVRNIAPSGINQWASIGATWGPTADTQVVYAFEPNKLGLVLFKMPPPNATADATDTLSATPYLTASDGLPTSGVVREGAHIRANANGTVFYACLNSLLYRGQRNQGPASIRAINVSPAVRHYDADAEQDAINKANAQIKAFLNVADTNTAADDLVQTLKQQDPVLANRQITVTAQVDVTEGKPRQVTIDLSRFNLSPRTLMRPAGEGVYATSFVLDLQRAPRSNEDSRRPWPGIAGLTVTAISDAGALSGAVGPIAIVESSPGYAFFIGHYAHEQGQLSDVLGFGALSHNGRAGHGFAVDQPGPWRVNLHHGWSSETVDLSSYYAFSFWIRTRDESTDEVYAQLRDQPVYGYPTNSAPIPLLKSGCVPGGKFTGQYQRVTIPLSRLLEKAEDFQPTIFKALLLSGTASKRVEYYFDDVRLYPSAEALAAEDDSR